MIETLVFGLLSLLAISGLVYLILYLPARLLVNNRWLKVVRLTASFVIGLFVVLYYSISPIRNNETATINKFGNLYRVTLTGERLLMSHDLTSAFSRATYIDTFSILVPGTTGTIKGKEIPVEPGNYKMSGTIAFKGELVKIDLYYDNFDDDKRDPLSWNGTYTVRLKEH